MGPKPVRQIPILLVAVFIGAIGLWGSIDRGAIQGAVTDPQGAAIPGAQVVVKNLDTNGRT